MVINLEDLEMIRDCSEANCCPIIMVEIDGKEYHLCEEEYYIDDDGDLIFECYERGK